MVNKKRTLTSLLYGVPILLASFLPMNKTNGQAAEKDYFSNFYADCMPLRIEKPHVLYFTFQPTDAGIGLSLEKRLSKFGVYCAGSWGNYNLLNGNYIKNHVKVTVGGTAYLEKDFTKGYTDFFIGGISYSHYGEKHYPDGMIDESKLRPLSIELGVGVRFKGGYTWIIKYNLKETDGIIGLGKAF